MNKVEMSLSNELEAALEAYRRDQPDAPDVATITQAALREYLAHRGYVAPFVPLRMTPAPYGSGWRDEVED